MARSRAIRTSLVAVVVAVLVPTAAAPALAGKGPKQRGNGRAAGSAQSSTSRSPKAKGPPPAVVKVKPKSSKSSKTSKAQGETKAAQGSKSKGRHLAKGHHKSRPMKIAKVTRPGAVRSGRAGFDESGARVLGLRMAAAPSTETSGSTGPALFPRPSGEVLPYTGGDIAAMLFLGLMVITIGGLIWRAPSLIDKPRRSRDLSI
jgi:hypothetical protein